jgi:hypothetical protein
LVRFQDILNNHYHRNLDHNRYNHTVLFDHNLIHINLMVLHLHQHFMVLYLVLLLIMLYNHGQM